MELYLKKYFWVVNLLVVMICAVLAARGTNQIIEAKYLLGGDDKNKSAIPHRAPRLPEKPKPEPTKDAALVAARNIFCSTCDPPKPAEPVPTLPGHIDDPDHPPGTSLPLVLLATSVARDEELSTATIANSQSNKTGSFWLHEDIPEAGPIVRIAPRFVDFRNKAANRVERIDLLGIAAAPPAPIMTPVASAEPAAAPAAGDFTAELDRGVKKIDDTHYEIDRSLVEKVRTDPTLVVRAARIVPSIKDGKANGFKMYAIRPNSVFARIGFQNGDTIHSINGMEITSPDKALEVYTKLATASNLAVQVTRRGQPVGLEFTVK